jgi:hypothetical protein
MCRRAIEQQIVVLIYQRERDQSFPIEPEAGARLDHRRLKQFVQVHAAWIIGQLIGRADTN